MRQIGKMAEGLLTLFCSEEGLTVNPSVSDEMGWDHYIEFPFSNVISEAKVHQSATKCKIQVKATDSNSGQLQVKVSNLRKMAVDPLPSFFLFVEYGGEKKAQKIFLRPLDEDLIEQILRRVREIDVDDVENKFHKKTMLVKFDDEHLLEKVDSQCFREKLESYLSGDFEEVIKRKADFIKNVGYEDITGEITFNMDEGASISNLIDLSLGIQSEAPIRDVIAMDKRFGLLSKNNHLSGERASLSIPGLRPSLVCEIMLKKDAFDTGYKFPVDIYVPKIPTNPAPFKSRYVTNFFEIVISNMTNQADFKFDLSSAKVDLTILRKAFAFIHEFSLGQKFEVYICGPHGDVMLTKIHNKVPFVDYSEQISTLKKLKIILEFFEFDENLKISTNEVFALQEPIEILHRFILEKNTLTKVTFTLSDNSLLSENKCAVLGLIKYIIGDYIFCLVYAAVDYPQETLEDNVIRYQVIDSQAKIVRKFACRVSGYDSGKIEKMMGAMKSSFKNYPVVTLLC